MALYTLSVEEDYRTRDSNILRSEHLQTNDCDGLKWLMMNMLRVVLTPWYSVITIKQSSHH